MEYKINSNCSGVDWKKIQFHYNFQNDPSVFFWTL